MSRSALGRVRGGRRFDASSSPVVEAIRGFSFG